MYSTRANLILGFHGCDRSEADKLISDPSYTRSSHESYDWLGHGMYFWENNPSRAMHWAELKNKAGKIKEPFSVGAVLELRRCLDLLDSSNIELLRYCFNLFKSESESLKRPIPENIDHPKSEGHDRTLRYLDCAIIEYTHSFLKEQGQNPFDSVGSSPSMH